MDHIVCLNKNSFPANDANKAFQLFSDSLQGLLELNQGNDRFFLYLDSNGLCLNDFELANDFIYADFLKMLAEHQEVDLLSFLSELEDKSPALDFVSDEELEEASSYDFYMPNHGGVDDGLFGLAWSISAILLSINSDERWDSTKIKIARTENGEFIDEELWLENIACSEHGMLVKEERSGEDINHICAQHKISSEFMSWHSSLSQENKHRVVSKLKLSCARSFNGGEPLFKALQGGMREIRFSAYPGGAIRILFKAIEGSKQYILTGFIKKANTEGYDVNIERATNIYNCL